jgi:hypothetical protein
MIKSARITFLLLVVGYCVSSNGVLAGIPIAMGKDRQATPSGKVKVQTLPRSAPAKDHEAPLAIFADIEAGWRNAKVDNVLRHFGKAKVAISIGGAGPSGGYFSKNQSYYLFKDLFKYTITKKFEFTQFRNMQKGEQKVYAVATRLYKRRDDGRLFKDKIYVSLRQEDDRWVISEIKSVR